LDLFFPFKITREGKSKQNMQLLFSDEICKYQCPDHLRASIFCSLHYQIFICIRKHSVRRTSHNSASILHTMAYGYTTHDGFNIYICYVSEYIGLSKNKSIFEGWHHIWFHWNASSDFNTWLMSGWNLRFFVISDVNW
jgi:hypothetical protein